MKTLNFRAIGETVYTILPFIIIALLWDHHNKMQNDDHYYTPDIPNSVQSSAPEWDGLDVEFYDLAQFGSSAHGWQNNERVLFLVPLRDASAHLPMFFGHLRNMTYPHHLIDLAFLISDTTDSTLEDLEHHLEEVQSAPGLAFGRVEIYEKDFGQIVGQSFSDRHGFEAQGPRRKKMAIARNWLLTTALKPDHSWVYWRDIDVETAPATILEDLMHHDKDVIVPNIWRPLPEWLNNEQPYDLNSWQESEGGIELAERLDEDAVIVEGYPEYATWRPHLAYLRDPDGDPEVEIELDGIGGVSILAKASVFRHGAMFPAFSFKKHAETEAFGKLCKTMGFQVVGLPHYVIWHIYEPSTADLKHMEWMASEELRHQEMLKNKEAFDRAWEFAFEDVNEKWHQEKFDMFKNNDLSKLQIGRVHWDEVDEYLVEMYEDEFDEDEIDGSEFLLDFDLKQSKEFEKQVLNQLSSIPRTFGQSKYEIMYDDFNNADGTNKPKKKIFKKFKDPYIPGTDNENDQVNDDDKDEGEDSGTYDLNSDKVVDQSNSRSPRAKDSEADLHKDKELFDALEEGADADAEDEGELEFKEQRPIEEAVKAPAKKTSKEPTKSKVKKSNQQRTIRTLYEIDEDGNTVATVLHTIRPAATKTPVDVNN